MLWLVLQVYDKRELREVKNVKSNNWRSLLTSWEYLDIGCDMYCRKQFGIWLVNSTREISYNSVGNGADEPFCGGYTVNRFRNCYYDNRIV